MCLIEAKAKAKRGWVILKFNPHPAMQATGAAAEAGGQRVCPARGAELLPGADASTWGSGTRELRATQSEKCVGTTGPSDLSALRKTEGAPTRRQQRCWHV